MFRKGNKSNTNNSVIQTADTHRSQQALAELVQILFNQPLLTILLLQTIGPAIVVAYFWDSVPQTTLLSWIGYNATLSAIFIFTTLKFRHTPPEQRNLQRWIMLFPAGGVLLGLGWGSTSLWPNVMTDLNSMVFLVLVVLGVAAAGIAILAPYLRSFYALALLIILPFAFQVFQHDTKLHHYLGIMLLIYLFIILMSGHHMKRAVLTSINLRLENLDLVDDLVEKNSQTEQAREIAVQADLSKSKFLAAASHDLRQPLHALGLFVDALESRIQYPEVRSIVENIRISTDALSDLLNALLDISKLDAGVLEPKTSDFQLRPLLHRIQTEFTEPALEKSLQLEVIDCDFIIHTDPSMLERILLNLVSNALRYTREGSIKLDCHKQDEQIIIEVHDTGIGINEDNIENIFEEFYQIENPERDRRKGLGLGLAIVKRLADLINCPLSVSSVPDKGSVFSISVPHIASATQINTSENIFVNDLKDTRVLIIDDEAIIRLGMRKVLEQWHCKVEEAESIEQALDKINNNYEFDIILTDYRLRKNQTGTEAIEKIHSSSGKNIPAIILTGDTDPQRLREAKDSGYKLLHKPVSSAKLRSLMSYLLNQ
ncbi:MAG: hybrid sensor histidine kinase/response regulator [Gammaproteobacteria bacterium]|nr:hybrid sensor histidine kinase/response regulator [Gammaproteobacteria bacterium]